MKNLFSISLAVAALATAASAQQILVTNPGGWDVFPASASDFVTFNDNNGTGQGVIQGSVSTEVGTSVTGSFVQAASAVNGYCLTGATVSGSVGTTSGTIEFYQPPGATGEVQVTLNAQPLRPSADLRGAGYSGSATAIVRVTCPLFGWLTANSIANAVPPPAWPLMTTLPVSATANAFVADFNVNMSAGGTASGTLPAISGITLFAGADADGTVELK